MIDLVRRPLYLLFMYLPDLSFAVVFAAPIFALNVNPTLIVANYFEGCGIFLDQLKILATDQTNFTDFESYNTLCIQMLQKQINICCRIRDIHGMINAMMQGTQLHCIALNCVVIDASFLGGRTDMRTPPQHTHQYIRHRHHSSRRNTAEGKILQYGASHSQSTVCLC